MKVTYRKRPPRSAERQSQLTPFEAVVTDDEGRKWVWQKPIHSFVGEYQGPMGMLGSTHKSTKYDVPELGTTSLAPRFDSQVHEHILEQFRQFPEEFAPYYSLSEGGKAQW